MSAITLLQFFAQALFVVIFVVVAFDAVRRPRRATIDIALLFAVVSLAVAEGWLTSALDVTPGRWLSAISGSLLMALPYLLLRLVDDFTRVPRWLARGALVAFVLAVVGLFALPSPLPGWIALVYVIDFVGLEVYGAVKFLQEAARSSGVTRRRMEAVAAGSFLLGLVILAAGFAIVAPRLDWLWSGVANLSALASGVAYFLGFAPPSILRRAWQEPELRAFLGRAANLPRLPTTRAIVREFEAGAAAALGAPAASIGRWDESDGMLYFFHQEGNATAIPEPDPLDQPRFVNTPDTLAIVPGVTLGGRSFAEQRAIFSEDAARDDPANAAVYASSGALAVLAAPITAGSRRLGVLTVYAPSAPIFAEDDLQLVQLLADQAAVILESRALIDEAARVQAREEAARLKDDFLSAAAHDLKTPLTTLVAQAQLLERRAQRQPAAPADAEGIQRIVRESQRLRDLVLELLDASRAEQGRLVGLVEPVDIVDLAREICGRHSSERHRCLVDADGPVVGEYDPLRISQMVENLVENAVKYSPAGGEVRVKVSREGETGRLSVSDQGIGIPPADLPFIFGRFHRGTNVDDRRFSGMGLGLFICRGIAEEHGGRIWVESPAGRGTTFHVEMPLAAGVLTT